MPDEVPQQQMPQQQVPPQQIPQPPQLHKMLNGCTLGCALVIIANLILPIGMVGVSIWNNLFEKDTTFNVVTVKSWGKMNQFNVGFEEENQIKTLDNMIRTHEGNDKIKNYISVSIITGYGKQFEKGDKVYVEDGSFTTGFAKVHKKGETKSWWVFRKFIVQ